MLIPVVLSLKPNSLSAPNVYIQAWPLSLDSNRLLYAAKEHIEGFFGDPYGKYWALYDISSAIVAAFIHCQTANVEVEARVFVGLATSIASHATAEACKREDAETCALLLDLVEVLRPVLLTDGDGEGTWQASYSRALVAKPQPRHGN